jgi:hypothetical protein
MNLNTLKTSRYACEGRSHRGGTSSPMSTLRRLRARKICWSREGKNNTGIRTREPNKRSTGACRSIATSWGPLGQVVSAIRCKRPHKMSRRASQRQLVRSKPKQRQRRSYVEETSCYIRRSCFGSLR